MSILKWVLMLLAVLGVGAIGAGQAGLLRGRAPADLGVRDGLLKPPSSTDNSVSSQAERHPGHPRHAAAQIAPLALRGDGPSTLAKIRALVQAMPGMQVIRSDPDYLYVQATTSWMKYVDDVEFWFDPAAQVIQVRSASRLGQSDLGANRKRVEAVRAALAQLP